MKRNYNLFLKDIISAMESIEKFVEGFEFNDFKEDDKTSKKEIPELKIKLKKIMENI